MDDKPTVFVLDDDASLRDSTAQFLRAAGFACKIFASAADFLMEYQSSDAGCLILDLSMPGMSGMELVRRLHDKGIELPTIIVSGAGTIPLVVEGMKLGVLDFLEKPTNPDQLLRKVGEAFKIDAQRRTALQDRTTADAKLATLTPREKDVLDLLVKGLSSKQIARQLNTATKTVDNHRAKLLQKTGALNTADLTRMAVLGVKRMREE